MGGTPTSTVLSSTSSSLSSCAGAKDPRARLPMRKTPGRRCNPRYTFVQTVASELVTAPTPFGELRLLDHQIVEVRIPTVTTAHSHVTARLRPAGQNR